jgi:uncharacterized membrane protein
VSFADITLCVASQRVFIVVYFVIDSVRKLLDTLSCCSQTLSVYMLPFGRETHTKQHNFYVFREES